MIMLLISTQCHGNGRKSHFKILPNHGKIKVLSDKVFNGRQIVRAATLSMG